MPTPEQQREYWRLSSLLTTIVQRHIREIPNGATSLALTNSDGKVVVDAYDGQGKVIGTIPNASTSTSFRTVLHQTFGTVTLPDENLIIFVPSPAATR